MAPKQGRLAVKEKDQETLEFGPLAPMMVDHLQRVSDGWMDIMVRANVRLDEMGFRSDDCAFHFCAEKIGEADRMASLIAERNSEWMDRAVTARVNEGAVEQWQPAAWMSRTEPASGGLVPALLIGCGAAGLIALALAAWGIVPFPI